MRQHFVIMTLRQRANRVIWYPFSFHYKILISRAGFMPPVRGRPLSIKILIWPPISESALTGFRYWPLEVESHAMTCHCRAFRKKEGVYNRIMSIELNSTVIYIEITSSITLCFSNRMLKFSSYGSLSV